VSNEFLMGIAEAIYNSDFDDAPPQAFRDRDLEIIENYLGNARAALRAMRDPTVDMVVKALPCERDESFDASAKKLGAAACMVLSGGKDIGLLEGEAVKQAAFLVRDYRLMIDAALA
jgi:hypothetical protein